MQKTTLSANQGKTSTQPLNTNQQTTTATTTPRVNHTTHMTPSSLGARFVDSAQNTIQSKIAHAEKVLQELIAGKQLFIKQGESLQKELNILLNNPCNLPPRDLQNQIDAKLQRIDQNQEDQKVAAEQIANTNQMLLGYKDQEAQEELSEKKHQPLNTETTPPMVNANFSMDNNTAQTQQNPTAYLAELHQRKSDRENSLATLKNKLNDINNSILSFDYLLKHHPTDSEWANRELPILRTSRTETEKQIATIQNNINDLNDQIEQHNTFNMPAEKTNNNTPDDRTDCTDAFDDPTNPWVNNTSVTTHQATQQQLTELLQEKASLEKSLKQHENELDYNKDEITSIAENIIPFVKHNPVFYQRNLQALDSLNQSTVQLELKIQESKKRLTTINEKIALNNSVIKMTDIIKS